MKKSLFEHVQQHLGATYNINTEQHATNGYCVALQENEQILELNALEEKTFNEIIEAYTKKHHEFFENGFHLGLWINKGKIYLDTSKIFHDEQKAIDFGKDNKQLAIFCLDTFETIEL